MDSNQSTIRQFITLSEEAQSCESCVGMTSKTAVLSERNGTLNPRVLFVAEAPGRKGGDRTRVPMCGDSTGRAFEILLESVGLSRGEVFITNAVLCNPQTPTGANRPPIAAEVRSCNAFLRRMIALLNPPIVATLGAKALAALSLIELHPYSLAENAGTAVEWNGRWLLPLYHPSPQVLISRRNLEEQRLDWHAVRALIGRDQAIRVRDPFVPARGARPHTGRAEEAPRGR